MINHKKPASSGHNLQNTAQPNLGEKIDELENLINDAQKEQSNIPVLDDLVLPEQEFTAQTNENNISQKQMSELVNTIDEKLSEELNSLLDLLKDSIKDSIIEEINTKLNPTDKDTDHPDQE